MARGGGPERRDLIRSFGIFRCIKAERLTAGPHKRAPGGFGFDRLLALIVNPAQFQLYVLQGGFVAPEIAIGVLMASLMPWLAAILRAASRSRRRQLQFRLGRSIAFQPLRDFGLLRRPARPIGARHSA